ncbi:MAG: acylphosphatase [Candidatus Omnitrophica bacterium]|nr:acylphosphatase [Candidatus Omnitrophota bacterium]
MIRRLHVKFSGRVHGVGFRFTAEAVASRLNLTGWVKNLHSGEVEIVAEGQEEDLKKFVSDIEGQFSTYISDKEISWEEPSSEFKEFGIRF